MRRTYSPHLYRLRGPSLARFELTSKVFPETDCRLTQGLGYTLKDCSFTFDHLTFNHHALGKLAERLVEKGMLAAAGEDDHRSDGGAGQQPHPVDAGSE